MAITQKVIPHIFRNKYLKNSSAGGGTTYIGGTSSLSVTHTHDNKEVLDSITAIDVDSWKNKLDKSIWDKAFIIDETNNLRVKLNLIGEQEVAAYGAGSTGGGSGVVTIVDNLTSSATDCALSANQGRVLKSLIDNKSGASSWNDLTDKPTTFAPSPHNHTVTDIINLSTLLDGKAAVSHTHTIANITDLQTKLDAKADNTTLTAHTSNSTIHITAAERTNWNVAFTNNHTHSNKSVLDGITSTKVSNWDGIVTNWNKVFYFDSDNNLRVKLNLIGEQEVAAYGSGATGEGSGAITIVDALTSSATDCALSANQGRVLKSLIDSKSNVSSWNDLTNKPSTFTPSAHNHTVSDITNLSSLLDGKAASNHTHNYVSTVKVGTTSYAVSANTVTLPVYPTTPNALKNPNALTISLNGTSQGAYDGSAAKSINITAANVGAASSNHTHSYLPLAGGTVTGSLNSTFASNTWINGVSNAVLNCKYSGYGAILNASVKDGRVSISTYPSNDNILYFGYAKNTQISAGTNSLNTQMKWDAANNILYCGTFSGGLDWNNITNKPSTYTPASHTHNYAGSSSAGGAATSANKVNGTLTFAGGAFAAKSFNGSAAVTVNVPTATSHLSNNSGFITTGATVAKANQLTTARTINGTSFNGTSNITTATWGNARTLTLTGNASGAVSINGGSNVTLSVSNNYASNADTVDNLHATAFARADQTQAVDLNTVNGKGIMTNAANADATTARHYPIAEAGTLFYGTAAYGSANQIYGTFNSNRWFARGGGGSTTAKTAWKEFAFKTDNVASATKLATARSIWGQSFNGTGNVSGSLTSTNFLLNDSTTNPYLKLVLNGINWYCQAYNGYMYLGNGSTNSIRIDSTGNLYSPKNIVAVGEVTAYSSSDKRLKKNIKSITNSLDIIEKLNPVQFNWNQKAKGLNKEKDERNNYGLIAQEVEEILPELIHPIYDKYKSVDYEQLIPILIQSIKELKEEVDTLKNKINNEK